MTRKQSGKVLSGRRTMYLWFPITILTFYVFLVSCDDNENDPVDTATIDTGTGSDSDSADIDTNSETDSDTGVVVKPATGVLVITTDYQTGAYSTVSLNGATVAQDVDFIHSDAVCHVDNVTGTPFVLQRLGADAVDVLNSTNFAIAKEFSVEPSSNPHDIELITADKAYVTRFGSPLILIVNPTTGAHTGTVDLSALADADGIPEISGMVNMKGKLYVTVSRLDRDNGWEPVGDSCIVFIDAATGQVEGNVKVQGTNIVGQPEWSEALSKFVISQVGSYGTLNDGGVQLLDPATNTLGAFIITEATLGGSLNKVVCATETKCFAIIGVAGDSGSNTHLVEFNPQTGTVTGTLASGAGWVYGDILLNDDNTELWLADRTAEASGLRIFNVATSTEKTTAPINVGLPPSDICFTK
jgi:hypothetical protein